MLKNKDLDLLVFRKLDDESLLTLCFPPLNKYVERVSSTLWKSKMKHLAFLRTKKYKGCKDGKRISWKQLFYEFHNLKPGKKKEILFNFATNQNYPLTSYIYRLKGSFWRKQIQQEFTVNPEKIVRRSCWRLCYAYIYILRNKYKFPFETGDPDFYQFILGNVTSKTFASSSLGNIIASCLQLGYRDLAECIQQMYE